MSDFLHFTLWVGAALVVISVVTTLLPIVVMGFMVLVGAVANLFSKKKGLPGGGTLVEAKGGENTAPVLPLSQKSNRGRRGVLLLVVGVVGLIVGAFGKDGWTAFSKALKTRTAPKPAMRAASKRAPRKPSKPKK